MKRLGFLLAALLFSSAAGAAMAAPVLERAVLVSRHGVRPPTRTNEELAAYAEQPWPQWPVPPGALTPHGAEALTRMGEGLRQIYAPLLSGPGCGVFLWSDGADSRTRDSGEALAKGLSPHCAAQIGHGPEGRADALFDAIDAGVCKLDPEQAAAAIRERLASVMERGGGLYAHAREALQWVLTPSYHGGSICAAKDKTCRIAGGENRVEIKKGEARLEGPLNLGSTLSEILLLEYAEGLPPSQIGWGRAADEAQVADTMALHNLYADVVRRNPYLAARRGSHLMQTILDLLDGKSGRVKDTIAVPADAKLVLFMGHDGNLSNLSGLLDAPWSLPGQPDATAPDTNIAFELWRGDDGRRMVKVKVYYQTLDQLRSLTKFDARTPVPQVAPDVPGCSGAQCTPERFRDLVSARLAKDCLTP